MAHVETLRPRADWLSDHQDRKIFRKTLSATLVAPATDAPAFDVAYALWLASRDEARRDKTVHSPRFRHVANNRTLDRAVRLLRSDPPPIRELRPSAPPSAA
jgi:uncharacterized protein with von Willebrand factor type A (vWA) domain